MDFYGRYIIIKLKDYAFSRKDTAMTLGAQLFSLRNFLKTPEDLRETFKKVKEIGYENVQFSGAKIEDPYLLRDLSQEFDLPIVLTHTSLTKMLEETDRVINEHKIIGCPSIGLGVMTKEALADPEEARKFVEKMREPIAKMEDAGLRFAYHNHNFEFNLDMGDGRTLYDFLIDACPNWQLIFDTYWVQYAGRDVCEYLRKIGGERLVNVHFKDMANSKKRSIVACGTGVLDFAKIYDTCKELGVKHVLIEQDNAVEMPDPFEQMEIGFNNLRPIVR